MREIKFRGYYNGDDIAGQEPRWLHGDLCHFCDPQIREPGDCPQPVLPDTVGQYTGLKDRDGNEIYEGDIVRDKEGSVFSVIWNTKRACFLLRYLVEGGYMLPLVQPLIDGLSLHVLGNTHDNPELLKPKKQ